MTNEELFAEWEKDAKIDATQLDVESLKIPQLHSKYTQLYFKERAKLKGLKAKLATLRLEKFEFLTQGPCDETRARGWKYPGGKILKGDVPMYLDGDPDMIQLNLQVGMLEERLNFLDSIVRNLNNRGFQIKNAVDFMKWTHGQN